MVVAPEQNPQCGPFRSPDQGGHDDGIQLDGVGHLLCIPLTIEPSTMAVCSKPKGTGAVGVVVQIWGRGPLWGEEEAAPTPGASKGAPPGQVAAESGVREVAMQRVHRRAEINHPAQEGAASWDDLRSEPNEGEEFTLGAVLAACPLVKRGVYVLELLGGEASLQVDRV